MLGPRYLITTVHPGPISSAARVLAAVLVPTTGDLGVGLRSVVALAASSGELVATVVAGSVSLPLPLLLLEFDMLVVAVATLVSLVVGGAERVVAAVPTTGDLEVDLWSAVALAASSGEPVVTVVVGSVSLPLPLPLLLLEFDMLVAVAVATFLATLVSPVVGGAERVVSTVLLPTTGDLGVGVSALALAAASGELDVTTLLDSTVLLSLLLLGFDRFVAAVVAIVATAVVSPGVGGSSDPPGATVIVLLFSYIPSLIVLLLELY